MKRLTIALIGTAMFFAALGLHYVLPRVTDAGHEEWLLRDQPSSGRPDDPGRGS